MPELNEQRVYTCGPYRGYCGRAELHLDDELFHGEVVGVRDVVTFQGRTHGQLQKAFRDSVDDYLAFCESRGEPPERPFSGKFLLRLKSETHRKLATLAELANKSLNQFLGDLLDPIAESSPHTPYPSTPKSSP